MTKTEKCYYTILLDIDRGKAYNAIRRTSEELKERGCVSKNIKVSVYPEDGESIESLLRL